MTTETYWNSYLQLSFSQVQQFTLHLHAQTSQESMEVKWYKMIFQQTYSFHIKISEPTPLITLRMHTKVPQWWPLWEVLETDHLKGTCGNADAQLPLVHAECEASGAR